MREGNLRADRILGGEKRHKPSSNKPKASGGGSSSIKKSGPIKAQQAQKSSSTSTTKTEEDRQEKRRQQNLLDVFGTTFADVLGAGDFAAQLQELKAALFNRDFEGAFTRREAALDVYAARWSPTRALCYGRILHGLHEHLQTILDDGSAARVRHGASASRSHERVEEGDDEKTEGVVLGINGDEDETSIEARTRNLDLEEHAASPTIEQSEGQKVGEKEAETNIQTLKVLSIGGAAAEIVAFADYISSRGTESAASPTTRADITLLDVGPWGSVVQRLHAALVPARVPSSAFCSNFVQKDVFSLGREELAGLLRSEDAAAEGEIQYPQNPVLITLLFTLNELYTAGGIKHTTSFLRALTTVVPPGSLLLVVDSPGSYSEAAVGKEAKRYPMQWLLDHTLVPNPRQKSNNNNTQEDVRTGKATEGVEDGQEPKGGRRRECKWEKIESHDSIWFRVADGLRYPIQLENMRYQMHLYRASAS
jgi:25S rRNA (uracil2843-N3)-methyltransferase